MGGAACADGEGALEISVKCKLGNLEGSPLGGPRNRLMQGGKGEGEEGVLDIVGLRSGI